MLDKLQPTCGPRNCWYLLNQCNDADNYLSIVLPDWVYLYVHTLPKKIHESSRNKFRKIQKSLEKSFVQIPLNQHRAQRIRTIDSNGLRNPPISKQEQIIRKLRLIGGKNRRIEIIRVETQKGFVETRDSCTEEKEWGNETKIGEIWKREEIR